MKGHAYVATFDRVTWRRLAAVVAGCRDIGVYGEMSPSIMAVIESGVNRECARVERAHNDGRRFPPVTRPPTGRPRRVRGDDGSTPTAGTRGGDEPAAE